MTHVTKDFCWCDLTNPDGDQPRWCRLIEKRSILFVLGWLTLFLAAHGVQAQPRLECHQDEVIVWMGGANLLHLQQAGYLEAWLAKEFSSQRPTFRDFSWEADTVFRQGTNFERWRTDGFGNLDNQLERVGATTIIAQFGQLESMAGLRGRDDFIAAYEKLIDLYRKHARQIVLITPTRFESPPDRLIPDLTRHNTDLREYVNAIKQLADDHGLIFVDLYSSSFSQLTKDGMHVRPASQQAVAREIADQLGVQTKPMEELGLLRSAVIERHRLWYDYWRPANWKLLYGDDGERQFTRGGENYIPFKAEWRKLLPLIEKAEKRVWLLASDGKDPGLKRPMPEVLHGAADANVDAELSSFSTIAGLQVNLFASEREGLTSPLALRWDPQGRMYVTVTTTYPHVFPGDLPNDKIIMLEDTNGDGKADRSTVFAEGLNIPTGLEFGDGGLYVGQNTELLFLKDHDGDGKADERRRLLGGFGNGDSHQTINSFIWSPGGELFFGQGDGCESRVETPWGSSDLYQAGFYRFRPKRLQLDPLLDDFMGPGNPWGVAFDAWGQIFSIDGAGGVTFLSPGQVPTSHRLRIRTIGKPGGYCGIGYLDGRHLPPALRGSFAIGDYKANRIKRFTVTSQQAGFKLEWQPALLHSKHRNFRPIDVKVGPDGAIYVVDWYNPITCHQDDAYRDPTRDKAHGRIWRISTQEPTIQPPKLQQISTAEVLDGLMAPEHWTRYQAKRTLTGRDVKEVATELNRWVRKLDPQQPAYEHHLYEALGAYETIEVVEPSILTRLLHAREPMARAYATRVVGRWHDRLESPLTLLAERVRDEHPLVRMEAVIACSAINSPLSMVVAACVSDQPRDEWIEYAFKQTIHQLRPSWFPAFQRGELNFEQPKHLIAVLNEVGGQEVVESLKQLVGSQELSRDARATASAAIFAVGTPQDLYDFGLDVSQFEEAEVYQAAFHAEVLSRLVEVARFRDVRPAGDLADLLLPFLSDGNDSSLQAQTLTLIGIWGVVELGEHVSEMAQDNRLPSATRTAALHAMGQMKLPGSEAVLAKVATSNVAFSIRAAAVQALIGRNVSLAAELAGQLFRDLDQPDAVETESVLQAFLDQQGGAEALALSLRETPLSLHRAKQILRSLFSTGRSDQVLLDVLNRSAGTASILPEFSEAEVAQLVTEAAQRGVPARGEKWFRSLACISCHQVGGEGDTQIGPDLTSIGTTLAPERITEELLWPNRQVKEGYSVVQVITHQGKIYQGYERNSKKNRSSGELLLQKIGSSETVSIKREDIDELVTTGSPMPRGLTSVLSRPQLLDLIQYLSDLGKIK